MLLIAKSRMTTRNLKAKRLEDIETLASVTVVVTTQGLTVPAGLDDPLRDDVREAIQKCRNAGVKVVLVTDDPLTAQSVAREIGLLRCGTKMLELLTRPSSAEIDSSDWDSYDAAIVLGAVLDGLTPHQFTQLQQLPILVFVRITPEHKREVVRVHQTFGERVCITGNSIDDAPALILVDVGVAMAPTCSAVALEVANSVLLDNGFGSLVRGLELGRTALENLRKAMAFSLTHLVLEMAAVGITLAFGWPSGLTTTQMLIVDLCTDLVLALSLAYEHTERGGVRPRRSHDQFFSRSLLAYAYLIAGLINAAGCLVAYGSVFKRHGFSLHDLDHTSQPFWKPTAGVLCAPRTRQCYDAVAQQLIAHKARTAWVIALNICQLVHVWMCKTRVASVVTRGLFQNVSMIISSVLDVVLLGTVVMHPSVQNALGFSSVTSTPWVVSLAAGLVTCIYNESIKLFLRHHHHHASIARSCAW